MAEQNFVDFVKICCRSGHGGAGSAHLYRDRTNPKGGPDGGDGGRGGHIILKGNAQLWTLLHLKYRKHVIAGRGGNGGSSMKTGAYGEDMILEVPIGTIARNAETGKQLCEISEDGETFILTEGGKGGLGNTHFKSPTHQTPRHAQPGLEGKEEWNILELKLLADVGLVGFPNAGKSTLLSVITAAKPKIADYPFTTLTPNLGIVQHRNYKTFVIADIPGIIENAHLGKGLGHRFLKHIERNATLLLMIPADSDDITAEYKILLKELEEFNPELLDKPRILAISKSDILDDELKNLMIKEIPAGIKYVFISAVAQKGLQELKDVLWETIIETDQNFTED